MLFFKHYFVVAIWIASRIFLCCLAFLNFCQVLYNAIVVWQQLVGWVAWMESVFMCRLPTFFNIVQLVSLWRSMLQDKLWMEIFNLFFLHADSRFCCCCRWWLRSLNAAGAKRCRRIFVASLTSTTVFVYSPLLFFVFIYSYLSLSPSLSRLFSLIFFLLLFQFDHDENSTRWVWFSFWLLFRNSFFYLVFRNVLQFFQYKFFSFLLALFLYFTMYVVLQYQTTTSAPSVYSYCTPALEIIFHTFYT